MAHVWLPDELLVDAVVGGWGLDVDGLERLERGATADVWRVDTAGGDRFVAKYAYTRRPPFELGLRAALAADAAGLAAAVPLPTTDGHLTVTVDWPEPGQAHALALLRFLPGTALAHRDGDPAAMGRLYGSLQAAIAGVDHDGSGDFLESVGGYPDCPDPRVAGPARRVADRVRTLAADGGLTWAVSVWDGPELMVDGDQIAFYDFGATGWMPVVNHVANRSMAYGPGRRARAFVEAFAEVFPLSAADRAAVPIFAGHSCAIYAWYSAGRAADPSLDADTRRRFAEGVDLYVAGMELALSA